MLFQLRGKIIAKKKVTKKVTKKAGQPTKFNAEVKRICEVLYRDGYTDRKVAEVLGVDERTVNNWKDAWPQFFQSIKDWKAEADLEIEQALRKKCLGFERTVKTEVVNQSLGVVVVNETKYYQPDTRAIEFWLKNRKPSQWREKSSIDVDLSSIPDKALINLIKTSLDKVDENKDENGE